MEAEGFPIFAITMQNEPLNKGNSMSLYMPWEDQLAFIKHLGPAFEREGIDTKILLFDHNYNYDNKAGQERYPLHIFADPEASKYADGSAWHSYGGNVSELDYINKMAPDKSIYFTEASIGTWIADGTWNGVLKSCILNDFEHNFLGVLSRNGSGVIMWNLMLDQDRKPYRPGGCATCFGAVQINNGTYSYESLEYSSHYYDIAHCSKVVKPGAKRIKSSGYTANGLKYEAFLNADGSYAVLALNRSGQDISVAFQGPAKGFRFTIPATSIVSLRWSEN
jgi:glucosylceramidase